MEDATSPSGTPASPPQVRRSHRAREKKSSNGSKSSSKDSKSQGKSASSATIGRSVSEDSLDGEVDIGLGGSPHAMKSDSKMRDAKKATLSGTAKMINRPESRSDNEAEGSQHSLLRPPMKEKSKKAAAAARILERRKALKEKEKERELDAYNKKKMAAAQAIMESNFSKPLTESKFKASFENLSATRKRTASSFSRKSEGADTSTSTMTEASGVATDGSVAGMSYRTGHNDSRLGNDSNTSCYATDDGNNHDDKEPPIGTVVSSPDSQDSRFEESRSCSRRGARVRKIRQRVGGGASGKQSPTGAALDKATPPREYNKEECKEQSLLSPASPSDGSDGAVGSIVITSTRYGPLNTSISYRDNAMPSGHAHPVSPDGATVENDDGDDWDDNIVPSPLGGMGAHFSPNRSVRPVMSEPLSGDMGAKDTCGGEAEIPSQDDNGTQAFYDCPNFVAGESDENNERAYNSPDTEEWEIAARQSVEEMVERSNSRLHQSSGSSRYDTVLRLDGEGAQDDNDHIPAIEAVASEASVPSVLEKDNCFHESAAAAVVALVSPHRSEEGERPSPSKPHTGGKKGSSRETPSDSVAGTASPRRHFDPVGVVFASTEAARYQDQSWEAGAFGKYKSGCDLSSGELAPLIDPETEQVLETFRDRMVEPSRQLSDLLTIIHSSTPVPENVGGSEPGVNVVYKRKLLNVDDEDDEQRTKSMRGHMNRRKNACGALKVLTGRAENRVRLAWTTGVLPALTTILNDSGPNGAEVTFPDAATRMDYAEARRRAVASLLSLVRPEENRTLIFHSPGLVQAMGKCIREDDGMARQGACACLSFLAKTKQNRLLMVEVPGLVDAITTVIRPPSLNKPPAPRSDLTPSRYRQKMVDAVDVDGKQLAKLEEEHEIAGEETGKDRSRSVSASAEDNSVRDGYTIEEDEETHDDDTHDEFQDDDTRDDTSREDGIPKSTISAIDSSFSRDSIESLESFPDVLNEKESKEEKSLVESAVSIPKSKAKDELTSTPVRKGRASVPANGATGKSSDNSNSIQISISRCLTDSSNRSALGTSNGSSSLRDHKGSVSAVSVDQLRRTESESVVTVDSDTGYSPDILASGADAYDENASNLLQGARVSVFATVLQLVKMRENAYKLARHKQLITTLVQLSRKHASPMHPRAVTLLAHMTRHNSNTKHMVFRVKYLLPSLVAALHSSSADSRRYGCYALQNLSGDRHCRQEMANTHNLLESLCLRARDDGFEDEQLAAIAAMKNLTDEPANIIPMTNVPNFVGTLMHIAQGQAEATPVMKYMACDGLATLSHWLRKMATSGVEGEKRRHAYAKAAADGMPTTPLIGYQSTAGMHIPTVETVEWNQYQ